MRDIIIMYKLIMDSILSAQHINKVLVVIRIANCLAKREV